MPCILNTYLDHFGCWTTLTLKLITFFLLPKQNNSRVFTPDCLGKSLQPDLLNWLECTWEDSHFCCKTDVCVMVVEVIHNVWALVNKSASCRWFIVLLFWGDEEQKCYSRETRTSSRALRLFDINDGTTSFSNLHNFTSAARLKLRLNQNNGFLQPLSSCTNCGQ